DAVVDASHFVNHTNNLVAVTEFVVVPEVQNTAIAINDGGSGVHNCSFTGTHKVAGYCIRIFGVTDLVLQRRVQRQQTQELVDLFLGSGSFQIQHQDSHGHVWNRYAHRVAGQFASQFRYSLDHSLGSA